MGRAAVPLLAVLALALGSGVQAAEPAKCVLQKVAELPITMAGMQPMVKVKINGTDTYLMTDSGAFYSIISEAAATRLGMTRMMSPFGLQVKGVNGSAGVEVYVAKDFTLADIPMHNIQFLVGGRELSNQAVGVLGENVLGLMDVEYDFANGVIRLFKPKDCGEANLAYWAGEKGASMLHIARLEEHQRDILGHASVNGQEIKVIFDTGAGTSVLKRSTAERLGIHLTGPDVQSAGLSYGFGRRGVESWIVPVANFSIGDEQIQNTRMRVGEIDIDKDMLLGADFFLSHRVYVSNTQHRLYFTYNGGPVFRLDRQAPPRDQAHADTPPAAGAAPAVAGAPTDAAGFTRRGAAEVARRDYAAAIADFSRAVELEPEVAEHYHDRALAHLNARQPVLAMADLDQALKLKPNDPLGLELRGELYLSQGDVTRAQGDFDAALQAAPAESNVGLRIAAAYERFGRFEAAVARYDDWIAGHPKSDRLAQAYNGRCWTRALMGRDLDKAMADCNLALKTGMSNSSFLDSRGLVHLRLGQLDAAIADYDASLRLQPKGAWSLYGRGLAKRRKGDAASGDADIQAALAIQPNLANMARRYGVAEETPAGPVSGSAPPR